MATALSGHPLRESILARLGESREQRTEHSLSSQRAMVHAPHFSDLRLHCLPHKL